jgi:hypothetical protein
MPVLGAAPGDCSVALLLLPSQLVALRNSKGCPNKPHVFLVGVAIVIDNVDGIRGLYPISAEIERIRSSRSPLLHSNS